MMIDNKVEVSIKGQRLHKCVLHSNRNCCSRKLAGGDLCESHTSRWDLGPGMTEILSGTPEVSMPMSNCSRASFTVTVILSNADMPRGKGTNEC